MSESDLILAIVVATALAFDFTNGFHDTANVVATSISTRAMAPRIAVGYAAVLNFVGAFISLEVAATVAKDVVDAGAIDTTTVIFAGLVGAIAWNLITWYFGLPSSSSHALIGGIVGATFAAAGAERVFGEGILGKVLIPALIAPVLAFVVGGIGIVACYRILGRQRPGPVTRGFRFGQIVSGGLLALGARHQRRAEDDGRDHARADRQRQPLLRGIRGPDLGGHLGGHGDRARHLHRRLADHQDDGHADHQDGRRPGLLGPGRRRGGDPRLVATSASRSRPRR